jgi:CRP/FNR family cyclic AMP-dependent transcriptional regulator
MASLPETRSGRLLRPTKVATGASSEPRRIDVRLVPIGQRHERIFALFDALEDDQALMLTTDHEPRPLRAEFEQTRPGVFSWTQRCVSRDHWEATIRRTSPVRGSDEALETLRRSATFANEPAQSIEAMAARCRVISARRNRAVVAQGTSWPYMGIVGAGVVQAVLVTPDGRELAVYDVLPGEVFGAIALADGGASPLRYVARAERTKIVLLPLRSVADLMRDKPALANAFNALTAQRLRTILERFSEYASRPITARVAEVLLAYAAPKTGLVEALPPLPRMRQVEIGIAAGAGKDMVYRAIAKLEGGEALIREGGRITHLDRARLTAFAAETK